MGKHKMSHVQDQIFSYLKHKVVQTKEHLSTIGGSSKEQNDPTLVALGLKRAVNRTNKT